MPSVNSSIPAQEENPKHYTYLKGFRTQQCPDFLQHKCTQHRPFTCFHWHFMNQRRRRPVRKRDGTFNYSPDVYCTKYDETTGICPEGDECPLLHRTAGDTERRYHLRYYKTSVCVHETDSKGFCVKNGPHCAFAHGAHDLRPPVYDVRELQALDGSEKIVVETPLASSVEKDRLINEDPRWNDTNYVLANYKTEPCKRPPRLCRQGYACPSYHNTRDRRRTPKKFKYRSTPCPNVKHGDDWGDPSQCDSGENCPYCHTRTEQQFHPEIYKSTKCNDMVQTGYCPRGPFCAFAHVEQEMTSHRDVPTPAENSLAAFVTNALPQSEGDAAKLASKTPPGGEGDAGTNNTDVNNLSSKVNGEEDLSSKLNNNNNKAQVNLQDSNNQNVVISSAASVTQHQNDNQTNGSDFLASSAPSHLPHPIGKGRTNSISGSVGTDNILSSVYLKAPGSEREDTYANLRKQLQAIETDTTLDTQEKSKRKQNLLLLHNLNIPNISGSNSSNSSNGPLSPSSIGVSLGTNITSSSFPSSSTMSPNAKCFYPPCDTVESVVGNALEEDLNLGELSLSSIDREMARDNDNDTNSVCSSMSAGFSSSAGTGYIGASSVPVTIPSHPGAAGYRGSISSLSPASSPIGSLGTNFLPHIPGQHRQEQQLHDAAAAFLSQPNPGKYSAPSYGDYNSFNGMSPRSNVSQSPLLSGSSFAVNGYGEVQRLREELSANKAKLAQWEDGISQARGACEAWKKEADEANRKAKLIDEERHQYLKQRDEAIQKVTLLQKELEKIKGGTYLHCLQRTRVSELDSLPIQYLQQLQVQLRVDLDTLEKVVLKQTATIMKCLVCKEKNRSVAVIPCNHYVMCETCATSSLECPYCHSKIQQKSSVLLPL